ncbi:MAG TPA: hypothetical protein DCK79_09200 [Candidatus Atribacteria bacterium]|nr:hypothetical protein [Candidatus Atribacteria bacterium]
MATNNQKDVEEFWKEKEQELGEAIKGKDMSEYISGYQRLKEKTWGLLYYTKSSFYFQTFPKRNWLISLIGVGGGKAESSGDIFIFNIMWEKVKEITLPAQKNPILSFLSPPDNRVFIRYKVDSQEEVLTLAMYSRNSRKNFLECYQQAKK